MPPTPLARARLVTAGDRAFFVDIARHPRARRYVLRVTIEGRLRLTVPRGASVAGGLAFARRQHDWIVREWRRLERRAAQWETGTAIWYRGERVSLEVHAGTVRFSGHIVPVRGRAPVRVVVEEYLRENSRQELVRRTMALAADHGIAVTRVTVRNQRSRWGSCSAGGAIALNWRLVQMPPDVADYVILHELAHRRHANHSTRFWREVEALCASWRPAERWLRTYGKELL